MQPLLRIILVIPVGYIAACLAAGLFFVLATIGIGPGGAYLTSYRGETLFLALGVAAWVGALGAAPATVAVLAGEIFAWRSFLFYLLLGGAIGLGVDLAFSPMEARLPDLEAQLFLATGAVAGAVYWLVAGRSAGFIVAKSAPRP